MIKNWKSLLTPFKGLFKTEDSKFFMATGFKVCGISLGVSLFVYFLMYQMMRLNYGFFRANGFPDFQGDSSAYYDYIIGEMIENLPRLFAVHVFLFFIGVYVGWLILRPFRMIGEYSEKVIENPNAIYKTDDFSTYRLLTRFSEHFFEYLREGRRKGDVSPASIAPQYSRIHQPVVDRIFLLHFGILILVIILTSVLFISDNSTLVFHNMLDLAMRTLSDYKSMSRYFRDQEEVLSDLVGLAICLICLFYTLLAFHLYNKVAGAAFGIFSTMRSFMKGNQFSRVHLVGYAYVREYTRKLNKYLDYIQNNYSKEKPKG